MKTFWNFLKSRFLWLNILVAVVVGLLICWGALAYLKDYTHHGEAVEVPDVKGLYVEEAELLLSDVSLRYEVVDSVYLRSLKPGEIAEQTPAPGTSVKKGRRIYLTTNCRGSKMITVPSMVGESRRKAQTNLQTLGFNVDSIQYKPYEFDDEVLGLIYNGATLEAGASIPDASHVVLLVGRADSTVTRIVPNLLGMTIADARPILDAYEMSLGAISYDVEPATPEEAANYKIYGQSPMAGEQVFRGKVINLRLSLTQKSEKVATDDEDFF